jgi:hypothetical protein
MMFFLPAVQKTTFSDDRQQLPAVQEFLKREKSICAMLALREVRIDLSARAGAQSGSAVTF